MANDGPQNYWQTPEDEQTPVVPEPTPQFAPTQADQPVQNPQAAPVDETQYAEQDVVEAPLPEDTPDNPPVTWTAQEYVHMDRSPIWFILFILIVLGLIALSVFLLKSWSFSVLIFVMAAALIVYIRRPPR